VRVERWVDAAGDHARAKAPRGAAADAAPEDQLDFVGMAERELIVQHLLKPRAGSRGTV
jgi:hypothetical protein